MMCEERLNSFMTEVMLYRNQFFDLQSKSMDWFLYDGDLMLCYLSVFMEIYYLIMTK